jgi:pimeloyl-ACP methyl ester carboxylesterase
MAISLFHRDLGGAGHPPLALLHGMLGSSRNWQTVGRDLAPYFHVHALDARNHGSSPHATPMDYPAMVEDVSGWLDTQGLDRATLMGHSMGGKTAMLLACRQPRRVERLIVVDMAPKDYHWPAHRDEFAAMNELDLANLGSRAEAEARFEARIADWAMRKFLATNLERHPAGGWRWIVNLPVITAALDVLEHNPLRPDDRYAGPTHFIVGEKSRYVLPEDHALIIRHFPAAKITILPAGHNPHMEAREAFVAAVRASAA